MNIDINKIRSLGKKLTQKSAFADRGIIHTLRDWMVILGMTTVTFLVSALYLGYDFYTNLNAELNQTTEGPEVVQYKREEIESVLSTYREQKIEFERLRRDKSNYPVIPEPLPVEVAEEETPLADGVEEQ